MVCTYEYERIVLTITKNLDLNNEIDKVIVEYEIFFFSTHNYIKHKPQVNYDC